MTDLTEGYVCASCDARPDSKCFRHGEKWLCGTCFDEARIAEKDADLAALRERLAAAEKSAFDRGWAAAIKAAVAKIQMAREECETDHRQIMAWVSYLEPPADDKEKR